MTPEQIRLVQDSWAKVVPIADTAADMFYTKLFQMNPSLQKLFVSYGAAEQRGKLVAMLGNAVGNLNNLNAIVPAVQALGVRHAGYGVKAADYGTVAGALLWTLEQGLGAAWNNELKAAWTEVYGVLAGAMQDAAAAKKAA
jgi:hemoglobin-like flavoprotein